MDDVKWICSRLKEFPDIEAYDIDFNEERRAIVSMINSKSFIETILDLECKPQLLIFLIREVRYDLIDKFNQLCREHFPDQYQHLLLSYFDLKRGYFSVVHPKLIFDELDNLNFKITDEMVKKCIAMSKDGPIMYTKYILHRFLDKNQITRSEMLSVISDLILGGLSVTNFSDTLFEEYPDVAEVIGTNGKTFAYNCLMYICTFGSRSEKQLNYLLNLPECDFVTAYHLALRNNHIHISDIILSKFPNLSYDANLPTVPYYHPTRTFYSIPSLPQIFPNDHLISKFIL